MTSQDRYKLIDTETGKETPLTTDEVQAAFFLAEKYLREREREVLVESDRRTNVEVAIKCCEALR